MNYLQLHYFWSDIPCNSGVILLCTFAVLHTTQMCVVEPCLRIGSVVQAVPGLQRGFHSYAVS